MPIKNSGDLGSGGLGGQLSGSALLCLEGFCSLSAAPFALRPRLRLSVVLLCCNGTLKPSSVSFSIPGQPNFTIVTPLLFSSDPPPPPLYACLHTSARKPPVMERSLGLGPSGPANITITTPLKNVMLTLGFRLLGFRVQGLGFRSKPGAVASVLQ